MPSIRVLLDFIGEHESGGDYNIVWSGIKQKDRPQKLLTKMTISEVLAWQDRIDPHYPSEAAGKYQIMEDTLRGLYVSAGFAPFSLFDEQTQDGLAMRLLIRRGLYDYINLRISTEKFANSLAREWASLPCVSGPKKGRSYYSGDGLNKALVDVQPFLDAVASVR